MAYKEFRGTSIDPSEFAEFIGYVCVVRNDRDQWWVGVITTIMPGDYNRMVIRMNDLPGHISIAPNTMWSIESFR